MRQRTLLVIGSTVTLLLSSSCGTSESQDAGNMDMGTIVEQDMGSPDAGSPDEGVAMPDMGPVDMGAGECPGCLPEGTAPTRRGDMAYAVDPSTGRTYMFFGDSAEPQGCNFPASQFLADAYVFHPALNRWETLTPGGTAPLSRARASGAWDAMRGRAIVFGGRWRQGTSGPYTFLNDLWAYDPATNQWEELSAQGAAGAPSGRMNTLIVADPANDRILVHAGGQTDFVAFQVNSETWSFNLGTRTWARLATAQPQPPARLFHTGAFDTQRQRLYIYGGGGENSFQGPFYGDLWYLDLATETWTEVLPQGPEGRIKGQMAYDEGRDRLLLFAGHNNTSLGNDNELWAFDLTAGTWARLIQGDVYNRPATDVCMFPADFAIIDPESPERRESHLFIINGDQALMHGGRTDCGLANDTWLLDLTNDTWMRLNESFTGMTCYRSGRTDCDEPNAQKCG